jgi:hypothetical protein
MSRLLLALSLSTVGLAATPDAADAAGLGLFRRDRCQLVPAAAPNECPPGTDVSALPPAPPGKKWVFVQEAVKVTRLVPVTETVNGRRVTRLVQMETTELRSVPQLVDDSSASELDDLRRQVAALQKALGVGNVPPDQQAQKDASDIQRRLFVTLTARVPADVNATMLSVSSSATLRPGATYLIGSETVEVNGVPPTATTVNVLRARANSTVAAHEVGAVLTPAPR